MQNQVSNNSAESIDLKFWIKSYIKGRDLERKFIKFSEDFI